MHLLTIIQKKKSQSTKNHFSLINTIYNALNSRQIGGRSMYNAYCELTNYHTHIKSTECQELEHYHKPATYLCILHNFTLYASNRKICIYTHFKLYLINYTHNLVKIMRALYASVSHILVCLLYNIMMQVELRERYYNVYRSKIPDLSLHLLYNIYVFIINRCCLNNMQNLFK